MKSAVILIAACIICFTSFASSQGNRPVPPHKLFAPQTFHVGATESFTFTNYNPERFHVRALVSYDDCSCVDRRRTCKNNEKVFSEASKRSRQGRPITLDVQMPSINQLLNRRYFVSVTSHDGEVTYFSRRQLSFFSDSFGFLLIKTDKPIYKPAQTVNFCLAFLDKSLKPHSDNANVQIQVRDSKFKQILKFDSITIPAGGIKCMDFPLAEELNFGTWRINVNFKVPQEAGGCQPFFSAPSATCSFKVEEFVLPRFEVSLDTPKQLERDEDIEVTVTAKYVFGENVQGSVKVNASLEAGSRRESLAFYERTATLRNGRTSLKISSDRYHRMVRYRYDPFCVKSTIKLVAEVEEAGRGTKIAETAVIPLVFSPVDVKFADDNPKVFRPGLNYSMKALASLADGSPANGVDVEVMVTTNNGVNVIFDKVVTSANGAVNVNLFVPPDTNCMKISIRPSKGFAGSCAVERECFSPSPVFSPTRSFLQLTDVSRVNPTPSSRVDIFAVSTVPFTYLHLLVISQGSIQEHTFNVGRGGVTSTTVSFRVTYQMVPKVKVLGLFAREDGELVADLIELDVECDLENNVDLSFSGDIVEPGDPISIRTATEPNSVVLVSVVDKSLTLLAEACKSLEKDNVCRLLRQLTRGSLSGGRSCNTATEGRCCPESCTEPTSIGVNNIMNAAGVTLYSNMFRPNPPSPPRPPPTVFPPFIPDFDIIGRPGVQGPVTRAPGSVAPPPDTGDRSQPAPVEQEEARVFFPESWIFQLVRANDEGDAVINSAAPDTITTWFGEAFSLSRGAGLGISRQAQITVSKPFFVSLELPFSINFGESVTITPLVFFFGLRASTVATISVEVDDDLDIRELSLPASGQLTVERGEGEPFSFKLHPRAIGKLDVTITAITDRGESDVVRKSLLVKPGCDKFEITENIFAQGTGSHCFNYSLPGCVIPGSASAQISVTGDLMSPPDLDRLLVLPTGCGEQNLVRTAVNWVVAEYLVETEQLQDFIGVKIRNNIITGFQRQLNYLQSSGCFSIWPTGKCSLWLTAAVVDVFSGIVHFYDSQEPGTELIDMSVIDGGLNYIIRNQRKSGEFPIIGRVHSFNLFRTSASISHTAFGIVALKQYMQAFTTSSNLMRTRDAVQKAEEFIENEFDEGTEFCNYALALSAYALHRRVASRNRAVRAQLISTLQSRISNSRVFPGACFLCPGCPSDRTVDQSSEDIDCVGRPRSEGSASCVETTAYALLALREAGDTRFIVCLAQWLVKIRSGSGGFYSSQDTVVAMKALGGFAEDTFTSVLNKQITYDIPTLMAAPLTITPRNRYERNTVNVPSVPSTGNCINWSGSGTAIIQSTLTYYGCDCCVDVRAFSLQLATESLSTPLGTILKLFVRIRYLGGSSSDMAIVDVETPSGYTFSHHELEDEIVGAQLERFEIKGTSVVFYFNDVPGNIATTFSAHFIRTFVVESPQQLPVTIYDYYDPGQAITKYYLPITSDPLPPEDPPSPPTPPGPEPTGGTPGIPGGPF